MARKYADVMNGDLSFEEIEAGALVNAALESTGADDSQWLVAILEGVSMRGRAGVGICCVSLARAIQARLAR